jgi:hypothetical protein
LPPAGGRGARGSDALRRTYLETVAGGKPRGASRTGSCTRTAPSRSTSGGRARRPAFRAPVDEHEEQYPGAKTDDDRDAREGQPEVGARPAGTSSACGAVHETWTPSAGPSPAPPLRRSLSLSPPRRQRPTGSAPRDPVAVGVHAVSGRGRQALHPRARHARPQGRLHRPRRSRARARQRVRAAAGRGGRRQARGQRSLTREGAELAVHRTTSRGGGAALAGFDERRSGGITAPWLPTR